MNKGPTPFPTLSLEEAIALLPDGPTIPTRYETVPNCGITHCMDAPREQLISHMREASIQNYLYESGPEAIKRGFGFHFEVQNFRDGSRGNLFVKTRNPN